MKPFIFFNRPLEERHTGVVFYWSYSGWHLWQSSWLHCMISLPHLEDWSTEVVKRWQKIKKTYLSDLPEIILQITHECAVVFSLRVPLPRTYSIWTSLQDFLCRKGAFELPPLLTIPNYLSELLSCYYLKINLTWQSSWSKVSVIPDDACSFSVTLNPIRIEEPQGIVIEDEWKLHQFNIFKNIIAIEALILSTYDFQLWWGYRCLNNSSPVSQCIFFWHLK